MTLEYRIGSIFDSHTQVIVNTVNCKGVMSKGLALEFGKRYPSMFKEYKEMCAQGQLKIGTLHLYKRDTFPWILNFPTKEDWRRKSKLSYIEAGLTAFVQQYPSWSIESIAFPKLGCQLGGLSWRKVKPLMEHYLKDLPNLRVIVYVESKRDQRDGRQRALTEYT